MILVFNTDQIYKHGGIEKVMSLKANYFAKGNDFQVVIVTTEQESLPVCYALEERISLVDLGVNYNRLKSFWNLSNVIKAFFHFYKQYFYYKKLQPDIVISPNYNFDHYWLPFILPKKTKLIKELHSSRFYEGEQRSKKDWKSRIFWKLQDWIDTKYSKIVVLNQDEAKFRYSENVVVIPNPTEHRDKVVNIHSKKVIAAGRIAPVKGFNHLVEAWSFINQKHPDWQLDIYGDAYGSTLVDIQELIKKFGLIDVVRIIPPVRDLPQTMLDYSIYALSSETECFPMVLLESLSVGLPIVSYDCPTGPRNIVSDNEDGFLVKTRKPNELSKKLIELIQDVELRAMLSKKAKENSIRFQTENVMKLWLNLINQIK